MGSTTPIKIISFDSAIDRRSDMIRNSEKGEPDWDFVPAYHNLVEPVTYDELETKTKFGRSLLPAEIGCYTSHFKCWEWLAQSSFNQMIILEDDILVDWPIISRITRTDFSNQEMHIVRLFATNPLRWSPVNSPVALPRHRLIRIRGYAWGTQGYLITKFAAQQMVARYCRIVKPIDWVLMRYWEHGFINYIVFPFPIIERTVASTISEQQRDIWDPVPFWGLNGKAMKTTMRAKDRAKRALFDLKLDSRRFFRS